MLTFGRGSHAFEKFGHNALLVSHGGKHLVYNFGTFDDRSPSLLGDFLRGRVQYWVSVSTLELTLAGYGSLGRSVLSQTLRLSQVEAEGLDYELSTLVKPGKSNYRYHFYKNNCSTRVRDILDFHLHGALKNELQKRKAPFTYRDHALRLTGDSPLIYTALLVVQGKGVDQEIDQWDELFLPDKLQYALSQLSRKGPDGSLAPLVVEETVLLESERRLPPSTPSSRGGLYLSFGLILGGVFAGLGRLGACAHRCRQFFLWGTSSVLFLLGLLGAVLVFLSFVAAHDVARHNANLGSLPFFLLFSPLAPAMALLGKNHQMALGVLKWLLVAALSTLTIAFTLAELFSHQVTLPINLFLVALYAGMLVGVLSLVKSMDST